MNQHPQQLPPEFFWSFFIAQGILFLFIGAMVAIGFWFVAGRIGRTKWAWALLSIIPFVNFFFFLYAFFRVLLYGLDRLNAITPPAQNSISPQPAVTA